MKWAPIDDLPPRARDWTSETYLRERERWHRARDALTDPRFDKTPLTLWTKERNRLFALETGQIESLYTMRPGITEVLITDGLENARTSHTVEGALGDNTLRGLLSDQELAIDMVFQTVNRNRPLSESVIKEWHALLTRHQDTAPGRDPTGRRIGIPFLKGAYKRRPNNPRTLDGIVHEYCPPEQTPNEMERLLRMHQRHETEGGIPTPVQAAWLHHRFVQIHPFEDGNGRCARLLMSYVFAKAGEPAPIITAADKPEYFDLLADADACNLEPFAMDLDLRAIAALRSATRRAERALSHSARHHHPNGERSTRDPSGHWRREHGSLHESVLGAATDAMDPRDAPQLDDAKRLRDEIHGALESAGSAYLLTRNIEDAARELSPALPADTTRATGRRAAKVVTDHINYALLGTSHPSTGAADLTGQRRIWTNDVEAHSAKGHPMVERIAAIVERDIGQRAPSKSPARTPRGQSDDIGR